VAVDIRLIATDLDGTLVHNSTDISDANIAALKAAVDSGITVCIATGRSHRSAAQFARRLGIEDSLIISYNGAMVRGCDEQQPIHHLPVPPEKAALIVRHSMDSRRYLHYFLNDTLYVTHLNRWGRLYLQRTGDVPVPVGDLRKFDGQCPTKLLIADEPESIAQALPQERERWRGELYVTHSLPEYIEYLNMDATKGSALAWLARHLGVGLEHTMALGDQLNDLEMIEAAGVGVMMASAEESLRARADFVPTSHEEGVAEALETLVLGPAGRSGR